MKVGQVDLNYRPLCHLANARRVGVSEAIATIGQRTSDALSGLKSTYAKPFLTVPEQIRRLRQRGMDCGDDATAAATLQRIGYYRLSGYWHSFRQWPVDEHDRFDEDNREVRLDKLVDGACLRRAVDLHDFDHGLRNRLSAVVADIEVAIRFLIGHRLGRMGAFAHRNPRLLGQLASDQSSPTTGYAEWLESYTREEDRAQGKFVTHFRETYGDHLPVWVATEVMSFGTLKMLYRLMPQADQKLIAARLQTHPVGGEATVASWTTGWRVSALPTLP